MSQLAEVLRKDKLYPLADYHFEKYNDPMNVKARYIGVKRCPKKGEWYLSGAIIEAYQAKNDLSTPYHIAEIVRIEIVTTITVKEVLPNERTK